MLKRQSHNMALSHKRTFLNKLRRSIPAIVLAIAGTYILSRLGTLHGLERLALDAEMAAGPHTSTFICLVEITDMDYDAVFGGRSPLQSDKLHDLISAIALSRPAVIGVDIDTSHPQFRNLKIEPDWPPVIWERDITMSDRTSDEGEPLDVLGGQDPRNNQKSGIPILLVDPEDKVTRLYTRCIKTKSGSEPTFIYALAQAYGSVKPNSTFDSRRICSSGNEG